MDCRTSGLPSTHHFQKFAQVYVHFISDAIQLSHPLMPSFTSALNFSQHQDLFQWVRYLHQFSSVQSLSHAQLFETPWTAAHQTLQSITNSRSPPKPMGLESVMPSNHLILCRPLLLLPSIFPRIRVFSESALHIRWPGIGVSTSTWVLPMNTQGWSPLGWTDWISS